VWIESDDIFRRVSFGGRRRPSTRSRAGTSPAISGNWSACRLRPTGSAWNWGGSDGSSIRRRCRARCETPGRSPGAARAQGRHRRQGGRAWVPALESARQLRMGARLRATFGLVAVDRATFRRTARPSAYHLGEIAEANRLLP